MRNMRISIRPEKPSDADAVCAVLEAAFPTKTESRLVNLLREHGKAQVSLVAEVDGKVVGHILFSPVSADSPAGTVWGTGLAPIAVLPSRQRQGIGKRLMEEGLAACRRAGFAFAVVLGDPEYYHRSGFERAGRYGLRNEYGVDEEFMALELRPGGLPNGGGLVKYAPEFAQLST